MVIIVVVVVCSSESQWLSTVECLTRNLYSCSEYNEQVILLTIRYFHHLHELKCTSKYMYLE